jgi:DNA-binding NarL/FixJ family response regulator
MATNKKDEILIGLIFDVLTGKTTEKELTAEKIAERKELELEAKKQQVEQEKKATARESALAKLAELGLTAEEIAAL